MRKFVFILLSVFTFFMASCSFDLGGDAEIVLFVDGSAVNQIGGSSRNTQSISKMALKAELYDGNALVASDTRPVSDNTDSINFTFPKLKSGKKYSVKMKVTGNLLYTMDNDGLIEPVSRTLDNFVIASGSADCVVKNGENAVSVVLEFTPFEDVKAAYHKAFYTGGTVDLTLKSDVLWTEPLTDDTYEHPRKTNLTYDLGGFTVYNMIPHDPQSGEKKMITFSNVVSGSRLSIKNGNIVSTQENQKGSFVYVDADESNRQDLYLELERLNADIEKSSELFFLVDAKGRENKDGYGTTYNAHVTIKDCSLYGKGDGSYGVRVAGHGSLKVSNSTISGFWGPLLLQGTECVINNAKITSFVPTAGITNYSNAVPLAAIGDNFVLLTGGTVVKNLLPVQSVYVTSSTLVMCGAEIIHDSKDSWTVSQEKSAVIRSIDGEVILTDSINYNERVYRSLGVRNRISSTLGEVYSVYAGQLLSKPSHVGISGNPDIKGKIYLYSYENDTKSLISKIGDWTGLKAVVETPNDGKQVFQLFENNGVPNTLCSGIFTAQEVTYEDAVSHFSLYCATEGKKKVFIDWTEKEDKYTQIELVDDEPSGGSGEVITF